jgi:hypothetical protein
MHRLPLRGFIGVFRKKPHLLLLALLLKPFKPKCLETEQSHSEATFHLKDHGLNDQGAEALALEAAMRVLEGNGFRRVAFDHLEAEGGAPAISTVLHYRGDIGTIAVTCLTHGQGESDREPFDVCTGLITRIASGRVVVTSNPASSMHPPPFVDRKLLRRAGVGQLIAAHLPRIAKESPTSNALSDEEVIRAHQAFVEDSNQYYRECGVYGPLVSVSENGHE